MTAYLLKTKYIYCEICSFYYPFDIRKEKILSKQTIGAIIYLILYLILMISLVVADFFYHLEIQFGNKNFD